ncbi:MAG: DNA-directed RNA polymerase subunit alpha [Phycisphaerae bacterium]
MRIRWRGLELPTRVVSDEEVSTPRYGKFLVEPFERGFGTTVGNALRRILLSSLEGAAVTEIKLAGADHEFMALPGVLDDVTDIILNIKQLVVKSHSDEPKTLHIHSEVKGPITAEMIETDPSIEVINTDLVIATLTDNVPFDLEMIVETGRGFVPAEERLETDEDVEHGVIVIDSAFSPVTRVRYNTENTRVGQKTNYDRLVLEVWTNGTITPEMAMVEAAKILRKHLNPFVQYFELGEQIVESGASEADEEIDQELQNKLDMSVHELDLSVRANNCLESAKVETVRDLVQYQEGDLLKIRSFGKTSLREVKRKLTDLGLTLGMKVPQSSSSEAVEVEG